MRWEETKAKLPLLYGKLCIGLKASDTAQKPYQIANNIPVALFGGFQLWALNSYCTSQYTKAFNI